MVIPARRRWISGLLARAVGARPLYFPSALALAMPSRWRSFCLMPVRGAHWRCRTDEQPEELGLFRRPNFRMNVVQVGLDRALADPERLGRFLDAKPWRHSEEHT